MIKVLIVEDQKTVQEILKSHLETEPTLELVGCVENGQLALENIEINRPHIVLMDIEMPVLDGLTTTKIITERFVDCNVLILSVHDDDTYLNTALQVGAKGYLLKNTPAKELINAIYSAYKGYFQLGPGLLEKYLYKLGTSQNNSQEITQLKNILFQQSKLLKEIQEQPTTNKYPPKANKKIDDKYLVLEQQYYSLRYGLDNLARKIDFVQKLCFFLIVVFALVMLAIVLVS
ncbi:response regulator transcription factor [Myxosarcina sp. GI1]|uniref:response regulator n=1 Tax=Myxosarcina sp. GI1 TaxID=1541065 RepID=UPI00055F3C87|nr:response regulator transcription factor [Myxosarcina sp. GI1]